MENITYNKGCGVNAFTYPLTQEQIDNIVDCEITNPKVGNDFGLKLPDDFDLETAAKEILEVRILVEKGIPPIDFMKKYYPFDRPFPKELPEALVMEGLSLYDPKSCADVVHMDLTSDMPKAVLRWLLKVRKANVKDHHTKWKQFIESVPRSEANIGNAILDAMENKVFPFKWALGIARPEEVLRPFTPNELLALFITAYIEGSPTHPAVCQGHAGAATAGALSLVKDFKLREEEINAILDCIFFWSVFRCFAGVHYGVDMILSFLLCGLEPYMRQDFITPYKK